jgi:transposase
MNPPAPAAVFPISALIQATIPSSPSRKQPFPLDRRVYRQRNVIERMFGRLKDFRRIATRYDKLARNFLAGLCLAAAVAYWVR